MELKIQLNLADNYKRTPCKEMNFNADSLKPDKPYLKSTKRYHSSAQNTRLNSPNNKFSLSPNHASIPLGLVSPCSVNISKQLQQKLKVRCKAMNFKLEKQPSIFFRTVV